MKKKQMAQKTKQIHSQIKDVRLRHGLSFKLVLYVSLLVFVSCAVLMITSTLKSRTIGERMEEIRVDTVMNGYKLQIKSEVQTGISIIQNYYDKYKNGEMTEKEAQEAAKDTLRQFRYGDQKDGYLWIDSTDYTLVMHPILPDQEGKTDMIWRIKKVQRSFRQCLNQLNPEMDTVHSGLQNPMVKRLQKKQLIPKSLINGTGLLRLVCIQRIFRKYLMIHR